MFHKKNHQGQFCLGKNEKEFPTDNLYVFQNRDKRSLHFQYRNKNLFVASQLLRCVSWLSLSASVVLPSACILAGEGSYPPLIDAFGLCFGD